MEMQSHAWGVLKSGPLSVTIRVGPPVPLETFAGRKDLALTSERAVRKAVLGVLRGRDAADDVQPVEPDEMRRKLRPSTATPSTEKWT